MKKLLTIIAMLVYFVVSTGFVVSVHYCMDKIRSFQLGDVTHHQCSECGMPIKDSDGCCKDEVKVVKLQVDQTIAKLATVNFSLPAVAVTYTDFLFASLINEQKSEEPTAHGPPLSEQDIYLRNCVFRI
jgi:hypothetical protein